MTPLSGKHLHQLARAYVPHHDCTFLRCSDAAANLEPNGEKAVQNEVWSMLATCDGCTYCLCCHCRHQGPPTTTPTRDGMDECHGRHEQCRCTKEECHAL